MTMTASDRVSNALTSLKVTCMSAQVQSKPKSSFELKCIPKINKSHFIATFVDTQRLHAKLYAEEGRALWNTLNVEHSLDGSQRNRPTKEAIATGFSTPVLVPRNLKVNSIEECRTQAPGKKSKSKRPAKPNRKLEESNPIDKKTKKRTGQHSDDDEVAARLAERRNRKRAKREIARPVVNEDLRGQTEASAKKASDRKITPGLALMHGFTATNLGKNRLTHLASSGRVELRQGLKLLRNMPKSSKNQHS
ncbi:hypothetical protein GYMLUDRAFT_347469 [Collybiopsis luxurians FD-317 M1]|nr:hypothetical protein GYMLUDRAFT_347469 [Collybiopsis luxurians FD-317 M1]